MNIKMIKEAILKIDKYLTLYYFKRLCGLLFKGFVITTVVGNFTRYNQLDSFSYFVLVISCLWFFPVSDGWEALVNYCNDYRYIRK